MRIICTLNPSINIRLMLTRGGPQKKVEDTKVFHKEEAKRFHKEDAKEELDNEVEGASSSSRWGPLCNL